ncbi:TetR/AcrR family transcriptional regulator [Vibrio sp. 10N.261.55.A7]|uniref:TetR/AcrR family transcriptional regulator n=1 Tax=Vibrio sp. 10N.261.55.A7 TaxID=1880851 RepID=UPI000C8352AB|nr:TetR/AcrR family transcriptional regulator [Vibrio sp. 10N.261.55.A7]PMJ89559.1 TetR family transcriptional regulator [Vibrio sp. 10N.261.55.A7]
MSEPKKTRSELKREAIVEAAIEAFKTEGVKATSMDKLAKLAEVSKRTVYNHFKTKEILVMELISTLWKNAMVDIDFKYRSDSPLQEQLTELLMKELTLLSSSEYIDLSRVAFGHFFYDTETLQQEVAKFSAQETAVHRWLRAAIDDNRLKEIDIDFANGQLHSLIKGGGFWPQLLQMKPMLSEEEMTMIAEQSSAMFLSHYTLES